MNFFNNYRFLCVLFALDGIKDRINNDGTQQNWMVNVEDTNN